MKKEKHTEKAEKKQGCGSLILFSFRMLLTVLISFLILSTVSYFVIRQFIVVSEKPVPNVVGLSPEQAVRQLTSEKFSMVFDKYEYSTVLKEGRIISQYPFGGEKAKIGSPVRIVLSKGSPLITVPDVRGDTPVGAGIKIRAAELAVGEVVHVHHEHVKKDAVISQDPPPRTGAPKGRKVSLLVSDGPEERTFLMPELLELSLAEARTKIEKSDFIITDVKMIESQSPRNIVTGQNPRPGWLVKKGGGISLTVSKGQTGL